MASVVASTELQLTLLEAVDIWRCGLLYFSEEEWLIMDPIRGPLPHVMQELYENVTSLGKESSFLCIAIEQSVTSFSSWKIHTGESVLQWVWFSAWWCEGKGRSRSPGELFTHALLLSRLLDLSYSCPTLQAHSFHIFSMSVESTVYPVVQAPNLSVILFPVLLLYPTPQPISEQVLLTLSSK